MPAAQNQKKMNTEKLNLALETLKGTNATFQITKENKIWLTSASHSVIQKLMTRGFNVSLYRPEGHEENFLSVSHYG